MSDKQWEYDVFISHNQAHKGWVREMVRQWRDLGLRVFFDEDSIEFGMDVVRAIEKALEASRFTILVITPQSVRSNWVAMEAAITIYDETSGQHRRLIPLLLEATDPQLIRPAVRRLNCVDLTKAESRRMQYHRLLRYLAVAADPLPDPPELEGMATASAAASVAAGMKQQAAVSVNPAPVVSSPAVRVEHPAGAVMNAAGLSIVLEHQLATGSGGGDLVDAIATPSGSTLLLIADVAGHGPTEAIVANGIRGFVRAGVESEWSLVDLMARLNRFLIQAHPEASFVTLAAVLLDPRTGQCETVLAGHIPPVVIGQGDCVRPVRAKPGYPIGFSFGSWQSTMDHLGPDELLVLMTDGITEMIRPDGRMLGEAGVAEQLSRLCSQAGTRSPGMVAALLRQVIQELRGNRPLEDDLSILLASFETSPPAAPEPAPAAREPEPPYPASSRNLEVQVIDDVVVTKFIRARILDENNISETAAELRQIVTHPVCKALVINFVNVVHLSSAALGMLITLNNRIRGSKRLVLCCIDPQILEVFAITKLDKLFRIFSKLRQALEYLGVEQSAAQTDNADPS